MRMQHHAMNIRQGTQALLDFFRGYSHLSREILVRRTSTALDEPADQSIMEFVCHCNESMYAPTCVKSLKGFATT